MSVETKNPQATQVLSERINRLAESATIAMAKKARELEAKGQAVIKLNFGEPDFQTPDHIKAAAKQAIDDGFTFYTPVSGYPQLRQAIADKLKRDNGLKWEAENIVVSTGAKQSLANVLMCLLNPGDEVVVFTPYWVTYREIIKVAEGKPVMVSGSLENNFKVTPEQLKAAITPKTKAILYSSPSNPTGSVYSKDELRALADVLKAHEDVFVIADEIYEYVIFQDEYVSMGAFEDMHDRVVTVNGFSKGFAMTGWRVGYLAAPTWLASACDKLQGQFTSGTCSIAQKAAYAAITGDLAPSHDMAKAYLRRRDLVLDLMKDIKGFKTYLPDGAFYIFPDVSYYYGKSDGENTINNSIDLCMYILNNAHVSLVPGEAFGADNCLRFSFAASDEDLKTAMQRIKTVLEKLN
ncbi:pyridoxal phosphate-dependent aminotransferase [Microscilla marina]|uniref:Aminotransferase n=1 Tax=Microscilla marina ATCC 23134 TaxID=313606 RepID=A1ZNS1_MICM2|nr:pyridoxal phosphate-dependent aminotransferase [Microscilla marina]EAY27960.1 aspartate aminotransferase [Microscilla marina ATCC 23134]